MKLFFRPGKYPCNIRDNVWNVAVIIKNMPLQGEALFALLGLIFPIMTGVLCIISYMYVVKAQLCLGEQKTKN